MSLFHRKDAKEEAFGRLFREQYPRLVRYAAQLLGDGEEARDVVGEVMEQAWRQFDTLEPVRRIPWLYTAGNHDWHYEGLPGTETALRKEWTRRRLLPLYQGHNPLAYSVRTNGLEILMIDNSTNEILPEQLAFFREKAASGAPLLLVMHVPVYVPGRDIFFSCGNPDWRAENDPYWQIERRPRWPENGHSETTMAFCRELFSLKRPPVVLAGHTHRFSMDCFRGVIQLVTPRNSTGEYLDLHFS